VLLKAMPIGYIANSAVFRFEPEPAALSLVPT
jgi:hypothetical protein